MSQPLPDAFSEKDFYLAEFRGRALGFAVVGDPGAPGLAVLESVLAELDANRTRSVVVSPDPVLLEKLAGATVAGAEAEWVAQLWRALRGRSRVGLEAPPGVDLAVFGREAALRLRLAKLVWIDPAGGLRGGRGERLSLLDVTRLAELLAGGDPAAAARAGVLEQLRETVVGGVPGVNLCAAEELAEELFSWEGTGTLLTRERYLDTRRLALDELDTADALVRRGVAEGYLVERPPEALDRVLSHAFGVFVEGRYLAGIGALLPHAGEGEGGEGAPAGEISSLYTLTRFLGEGVGGHLVRFALSEAREAGYAYVFACTTSARVQAFFERQGFRRCGPEELPPGKWVGYPSERRARLGCLRHDL